MCENRDRAECGKTKYNEKQFRRTKPVATCAVSLARMKQDSTHLLGELCIRTNQLVRCVTKIDGD
jgi:hypothetical protein